MGQLDGTRNPPLGAPVFDGAVWVDSGPAWLHGGTTAGRAPDPRRAGEVGRRRPRRQGVRGRPPAGQRRPAHRRGTSTTSPTSTKTDELGLHRHLGVRAHRPRPRPVRPAAHLPPAVQLRRRAPAPDGRADAGLIFAAYQRDIGSQFLPIQRNLAEKDLLNEWITPIGSAVFAVPPGCAEGGWIGEGLLA